MPNQRWVSCPFHRWRCPIYTLRPGGADDDEEESDRDLPTFRKKQKYAMAMDEDGNCILPDPDRNGGMNRAEMEQTIRTFVTDHYRMGLVIKICIIMLTSSLEMAANNPKASIPWN